MDEGLRRHASGQKKSHPKKQKSGATITSQSSKSYRLSPGGSFANKGDLPELLLDRSHGGYDAVAELPVRGSIMTEADSVWHESSKLFSMAVQPTEAHLNTQTSLHNLGTNASVGQTSVQDEKGDEASEVMDLGISSNREPSGTLQAGNDPNRQKHAASPERAPNERGGPSDKRVSRFARRWDSAPSPRGIIDDSALEVDQSQLRSSKSRQEKDKRPKPTDTGKLHSRGVLEGNTLHPGTIEVHGQIQSYPSKHVRAHDDAVSKELGTGSTLVQTAAKQTSFLQRHVSHKAERAERQTHSAKLNEVNLNSLEPRKEQRIDPKERIMAWIDQGEAYLQAAITPRSSTQELNSTSFQPNPLYSQSNTAVPQPNSSAKKESRSKGARKSRSRKKKNSGLLGCLGCLHSA